jgi:hypothetical protein
MKVLSKLRRSKGSSDAKPQQPAMLALSIISEVRRRNNRGIRKLLIQLRRTKQRSKIKPQEQLAMLALSIRTGHTIETILDEDSY